MRIAFVSHEFVATPGGGGIGTYLRQVTSALAADGHEVHVFCGTDGSGCPHREAAGVTVHRVTASPGEPFRHAVVSPFRALHEVTPFDVLEGTDFDAPANAIKRLYPDLPYAVKLHTPRFVIDELHTRPLGWPGRLRMRLGAWRRAQPYSPPVRPSARVTAAEEKNALLLADEIVAPSQFVATAAQRWVAFDHEKLSVLPYPYTPPSSLLEIPDTSDTSTVLFLGRLEVRKGVLDLARAAQAVHAQQPGVRFVFAGRVTGTNGNGDSLVSVMKDLAGPAASALTFVGPVEPERIAELLAQCAVLVLPSHWESYGLVCCEAMAAARPVVASTSGGMREILDETRCGRLVPPRQTRALAETLNTLLNDPELRRQLGRAGRERIQKAFTPAAVLPRQVESYARACARCRATVR